MKKTINITLGSLVFNIEEDAFARLSEYLDGLKKHFGSADYGQEVVNDIESRFGEQLNARLKDRKKEAATMEDIDEIIKTMGSVEDLSGEPSKAQAEANRGKKRLFRNPDDKIIAGVASGVANFFNIDPLITRILFAITVFAGGWGIPVYIVLWIAIPEAQTGAEKLEMKGSAVNLTNLTESWKEKKDMPKVSVIRYFFRELIYLLGRLLRVFMKVLFTIIGLVATAASFVAFFAISLTMIVLIFNHDSSYIHPAITQVFNGSRYVLLIISGYLAAVIPAIVLLMIGVSLVRRKNIFHVAATTTLAIIWLIGALTFGGIGISSADQVQAAVKSIEERPQESREFTVTDFHSVETIFDQKVTITHGPVAKVIVYGTEEQVKKAQANVEDGKLSVTHEDGNFRICIFCIDHTLRVDIITPTLDEVNARNASEVTISGFPEFNNFNLRADNASRVTFKGSVKTANVFGTNASHIIMQGKGENVKVQLTNASRLDGNEFPVQTMDIQAMNSSHADINVGTSLTAKASGASRIEYLGSPTDKNLDESNSAHIEGN